MRTSLVNRQQMENIAQIEVCRSHRNKQFKGLFWLTLVITYLCYAYYAPTVFGRERNPECEMKTAYANAMFAIYVLGAHVINRLVFLLGYCCNSGSAGRLQYYVEEGMKRFVIGEAIITLVGWTLFFYWTNFALWNDISTACTEGRDLLDFLNWLGILGLTIWPTILMTIMLCIGICCFPCIYQALKEYFAASREE